MHCKNYLLGLANKCPLGKRVSSCYFSKFKDSEISRVKDSIKQLPIMNAVDIIDSHRKCVLKREYNLLEHQV